MSPSLLRYVSMIKVFSMCSVDGHICRCTFVCAIVSLCIRVHVGVHMYVGETERCVKAWHLEK